MDLVTDKIIEVASLKDLLEEKRQLKKTVALCHGVFDLMHPGHIKHLEQAKKACDVLVVSITADQYVNKGPGRPVFNEALRAETLASLRSIDYVVINDAPDSISLLNELKPDLYVKGMEYKQQDKDITGKISQEEEAVTRNGGSIFYTNGAVFSSSKLLNSYFSQESKVLRDFMADFKTVYKEGQIIDMIHSLQDLKVLVIGDAILDEYVYVDPMGQSGKGLHMTARIHEKATYLGGAFAIANHVSSFTPNIHLLTGLGENDRDTSLIQSGLNENIEPKFIGLSDQKTLVKTRYVSQEQGSLVKLFETYSSPDYSLGEKKTAEVIDYLKKHGDDFDLIIISDFGNGLLNSALQTALSNCSTFTALNTQINSGNRGHHVVTSYQQANFISINEAELRLATYDRYSDTSLLMQNMVSRMSSDFITITQGAKGVLTTNSKHETCHIPALATKVLDRVGAGDSYLALASLALAKKLPMQVASFLGAVAAAMEVQDIGNKTYVKKIPFCKYITTLLK